MLLGWAVAEVVRNFLHFLVALRAQAGINDPHLVGIWLYNCLGVGLPLRFIGRFGHGPVNQWNEGNDLFVGPMLTHLDAPDPAAKQLADRFWNAFHFGGCPFFGADGTLAIPEN